MKVVIMAGGKGTRISSVANDIPKPMIKIAGKPVLEHEIECLRDQGFTDIIITVGYLKDSIINYFGDGSKISPITNEEFGVNIEYFIETEPLGNAGALFKIKDKLTENFLLLNGDVMFNIDFNRFVDYHKNNHALVTLFTHPNSHPYDSGLIITDKNGFVSEWLTKEDNRPKFYQNRVNAGLHIVSHKILDMDIKDTKVDLDRQLLKPLAGTGKMIVYDSPEYVKDMGTPDRYYQVCNEFESGIISQKNLINPQRAIFLDRDGTINKYVGFLKDINDFSLIDGVSTAIKKINNSSFLSIVITNQPVIARGELDFDDLREIHNKMETELGLEGAFVNGLYFCPHHPDKGFEGERTELKFNCECRKPKPGMLLSAKDDFNITLEKSYMIGDSENDVLAGKSAGCHTILIGENDYGQDYTCNSLLEAVNYIFSKENTHE